MEDSLALVELDLEWAPVFSRWHKLDSDTRISYFFYFFNEWKSSFATISMYMKISNPR